MSARTEHLLTEISELQKKIAENPDSPSSFALKKTLAIKQRELSSAQEALTEGKQLLKS